MSYMPMMIPFFIGGPIDRSLFKWLVIGLACVFFVAPNLGVYIVDQNQGGNPCPIIYPKDSQVVKEWKQTCYDFDHQMHFDLPIITGILASAILTLGYVRLRLDSQKTKSEGGSS